MSFSQRRGFLRSGEFKKEEVYAELDYLHQVLNQLSFPLGNRIFLDYSADIFSRRIYCMKPGLIVRLPLPRKEDDGWVIFIQDRSGEAATGNITIMAPTGKVIASPGASPAQSLLINSNYGFKKLQWDNEAGSYYEIS